jgi:phenylalanyl-tRNA synthetase alpha chain
MSTSRFVESAFWNFDSMFVPQQHPAREVQDTFYVKSECPLSHFPVSLPFSGFTSPRFPLLPLSYLLAVPSRAYLSNGRDPKNELTPDPPKAGRPDEEYYQRVAKVHESGGYGSIGYRAPFSRDDSERLLLRTHTTAVSTNMLYKIANQPGGFKPAKMFSIDRVFR